MKKKILIPLIVIGVLLIGSVVYLAMSLNKQKQANQAMQELAEIERYFAKQRTGIKAGRTASKAAYDYYKNMSNTGHVPPQFMDSKK